MKNVFIIAALLAVSFSCKDEAPKDYASISGKIDYKNSDSLVIRSQNYNKTIKVLDDGTFKDTLKIEAGVFNLFDGNESTYVFLKNGYDLNLTLNTKEFDETISYTGNGAETNNYLAQKILWKESHFTPALFDLDEQAFKDKVGEIKTELAELIENATGLDSIVYTNEKNMLEALPENLLKTYNIQKARASLFTDFIGKPSPIFENYENYNGGAMSLSDLKGKYVYIDVWATWCGPCKREIPFLKEIEHKYSDKNIAFVSISVDDGRGYRKSSPEEALAASKEGWKKMITEKEMGGIQLFSDEGWKSKFVQDYKINGIPRFILIDPDGNVVSADAPRPSSPKLTELFSTLEI